VNRWGAVHQVLIILTIRQVPLGTVFVSNICLALSGCFVVKLIEIVGYMIWVSA